MGIFDIFKSGPSSSAIAAQVRKAKEVYAQPEYRRMAMEKLLKWATPESYKGLLERFCAVVQSPHWDEDEKRWLVDELVKIGDKVQPILKEFILTKNEVNYALLAYKKIVNDDQLYKALVLEALKVRSPSDHRSVQAKQELIATLSEILSTEVEDALLPYLDDHSDDVQCAAIDALSQSDRNEVSARLVELLKSEVHSARVLRKAAHVVSQKEIAVSDNTALSDVVKEDYRVESGVLLRLNHEES